jgi:hypothetical protein
MNRLDVLFMTRREFVAELLYNKIGETLDYDARIEGFRKYPEVLEELSEYLFYDQDVPAITQAAEQLGYRASWEERYKEDNGARVLMLRVEKGRSNA